MKRFTILVLIMCLLFTASSCATTNDAGSSADIHENGIAEPTAEIIVGESPQPTDEVIVSESPQPTVLDTEDSGDAVVPDAELSFVFPGDWIVIESIYEDPEQHFYCRLIGESDESIFLGITYRDQDKGVLDLRKLSKIDYAVKGTYTVAEEEPSTVYNTGSSFIIQRAKQADIVNYDFELVDTIDVPQEIQAKMVDEYSEEKQMYVRYFAGYTVTADGSRFYYSNEEGLYEFDTATKKEVLLLDAPLTKTPLSYEYFMPSNLQLRDAEQILFFVRPLYEGLNDAGYVKLSDRTVNFLPVFEYADIRYEYSRHYLVPVYGDEEITLRYYDLSTGEGIDLTSVSYNDFIKADYPSSNRYGCFSISRGGTGETDYYRYDAVSGAYELVCTDEDYKITIGDNDSGEQKDIFQSNLIGILDDGRILLHFFQNGTHALVLTGD